MLSTRIPRRIIKPSSVVFEQDGIPTRVTKTILEVAVRTQRGTTRHRAREGRGQFWAVQDGTLTHGAGRLAVAPSHRSSFVSYLDVVSERRAGNGLTFEQRPIFKIEHTTNCTIRLAVCHATVVLFSRCICHAGRFDSHRAFLCFCCR